MASALPIAAHEAERLALLAAHFGALYDTWAQVEDGRDWTYVPVERSASRQARRVWLMALAASENPLFFTVVDRDGDWAVKTVALMRRCVLNRRTAWQKSAK